MHYKSIVLELIQEQHPGLHEQLRSRKTLLAAVNRYAMDLKSLHDAQMAELRRKSPPLELGQIASQALEMALMDLQAALRSGSPASGSEAEIFSLDAAMASIRHRIPNA